MKLKLNLLLALLLLSTVPLLAADKPVRYDPSPGVGTSKLRLEGTSIVHDWHADAPMIHGFLEVGPGFPMEPGQAATPGKIEAHGQAAVAVRQLFSGMDSLDDKMRGMLKMETFPLIIFRLSELTLKEAPKGKDDPYIFDSTGDLSIAGVTNKISMEIKVFPMADKKMKIIGVKPLKMTDYGIEPAKLILPQFKTSDDVTVKFEWGLGQRATPAPAK